MDPDETAVSSGSKVFAYSAIQLCLAIYVIMCLMLLIVGPCIHFISLFYRN